ncbi:PAS domain-containing sensor histidine kinase [Euzebya pacifica]|nr:PAS domain-containing sensor histidine kinase [Euzebya pacifica]
MSTHLAQKTPADMAALELIADAAVIVGSDGAVTYANTQALRLLRLSADRVVGQQADHVLRLRTEDGADWWATCTPMQADAALLPRIAEQELTLVGAGTSRAVAMTGARLADDAGRTAQLVLTIRRADARRRRDVARSDLVSTVSHELRSPLTSVKGFTKTLLAKWDRFNDEQKKQMLATVNEDADRVTRLLGELLAVSRIDAGRLQLKRQMIDMAATAARVGERVEAGVGHGRTITVDIGELPQLYADPDRVEQILSNLLENAIRYTGGKITITASETEEFVEVAVADEGDGIPEEFLNPIFTKFFRKPGERKQGTGLGLYITKGLVQAHGGEIVVESTPGSGSVFRFTLPKGGLELAGIDLSALRHTNGDSH